jgi:hypothetical protein
MRVWGKLMLLYVISTILSGLEKSQDLRFDGLSFLSDELYQGMGSLIFVKILYTYTLI